MRNRCALSNTYEPSKSDVIGSINIQGYPLQRRPIVSNLMLLP
jgi:hypothetical protein